MRGWTRQRRPQRVAVVGAGVVGLSTAWFLAEHGCEVTVLERSRPGAGASWGNAGWLTPALIAPLPEPAVLRQGVRALLRPSSPVYVAPRADPRLWRFLAGFARHCTAARWQAGAAAYAGINAVALESYDALAGAAGLPAPGPADPFLLGFADRGALAEEVGFLERVARRQPVDFDVLDGAAARALEPALSAAVSGAVRLHGQRFLDPPRFVAALAEAVAAAGVRLRAGAAVTEVRDDGPTVLVRDAADERLRVDAVVLATGAALGDLAAPFGVRRLVHPGRGCSFSVPARSLPRGPLYFPAQRVACTPLQTADGPRLRVAGMMEVTRADAPLDPRRVAAVVDAVRPLLDGVDLDDRRDEWVGSRPCTTDGLPLVGRTASPRVHVAGGHGMWGVALGPATGRLLAEQLATGVPAPLLAPFDPLR